VGSAKQSKEDQNMRKQTILKLVAIGFALSLIPMINGCNEEGTTSPEPIIQDTSPPAPPMGIEIERRLRGVKLNWTPNLEADLAGYNLWIYNPSPGAVQAYQKLNDELITDIQYACSKLPAGDPNYYFRLTAVDVYGNQSAWSNVIGSQVPYIISAR
jgi:hypothetical protein